MRAALHSMASSGSGVMKEAGYALLMSVGLLLTLPVAMTSMPIAIVMASGLVVATAALWVGGGRTGSGLLVLGFATVPLNDLRLGGALGFMEFSDVFFMAGFVLIGPRLLSTELRIPSAFALGAAGLLTVGTMSALFGDQPTDDFQYLMDLAIGVVLVPVLLVWWQPGRRHVTLAAGAYMVGNVINVMASLLQDADFNGRHAGLTSHPNVMGLCALLSLALAPFLLNSLAKRHAWLVGIGTVISAYGIWISGSRAALLSATALLVLYPLLKRSITAALVGAGLWLPGIVVVDRELRDPDPTNALGRLFGAGGSSKSDSFREAGAQAGIDQFLNHPWLGDGWGTVFNAHNAYLQIAAAIGLFGLIFYLTMLIPLLRPLVVVPAPYGLLALPVLAAVMISVVDPALGSRYIWSIVALALCAERLAASGPGSARTSMMGADRAELDGPRASRPL